MNRTPLQPDCWCRLARQLRGLESVLWPLAFEERLWPFQISAIHPCAQKRGVLEYSFRLVTISNLKSGCVCRDKTVVSDRPFTQEQDVFRADRSREDGEE